MAKIRVDCARCGRKMVLPGLGINCNRCGSNHIARHGGNTTVKKGTRRRFKCQDCGHTFYKDEKNGGK